MKISSRSRYALLTVLDLTIQRSAGVSKVHDIARRQQIPQKFLEQILLVLKSGGLVASKRGAKGGYRLKKEPETISVADVLALTEDAVMASATAAADPLAASHSSSRTRAKPSGGGPSRGTSRGAPAILCTASTATFPRTPASWSALR